MTQPETASLADFATLAGYTPRHARRMMLEGRLALVDASETVRVAESLARIDASKAWSLEQRRAALATVAGFSDFALIAQIKPSYVTQLRKDGRLVLTDDGKAVRVLESLERIQATRDPARQDVVERHAAARTAASGIDADDDAPDDELDPPPTSAPTPYQEARARKEHFLALQAQRDYEQSMGKLLDAEEVTGTISNIITALRVRLEGLPTIYAAQLAAESDEVNVRTTLADAIRHALEETSRKLAEIGKAAGA